MKVEIDLNEVFGGEMDEEGNIPESMQDQIINIVTGRIYQNIERKISQRVDLILENEIKLKVGEYLDALIPDLMEYEFQETGRYGAAKEEKTTVKNKILKILESECVYKPATYSSDRTPFTNAMTKIIEAQMKLFKPEFNRQVDAMFVQEAMNYATEKLKKTLKI